MVQREINCCNSSSYTSLVYVYIQVDNVRDRQSGLTVHRLTMIQWPNLTKCGLFFIRVSLAVHILLSLPMNFSVHPGTCNVLMPHSYLACDRSKEPVSYFMCGPCVEARGGSEIFVRIHELRGLYDFV